MGDILFWLIELILKAIFHQSRKVAKTTQPMNQQPRNNLPTAVSQQEALQKPKPQEVDVWEEYRKKQEVLHHVHEVKRPKS